MNSPGPFIIFNRLELTPQVFAEIQKAKPPILFVIVDGPRKEFAEDDELVKRSRAIINRVDWPCDFMTNYAVVNLSPANRVSGGTDWMLH